MTLALSLGMRFGVRRTLPMMGGELIGVGLVAVLAVVGVAALMLNYPLAFTLLKTLGGAYLLYVGYQQFQSSGKLALRANETATISGWQLAIQGFVTAVANPKGWAFTVSLLPTFINPDLQLAPQLTLLVAIILLCEFTFLLLYASGGKVLRRLLEQHNRLQWLNRLSGGLIILVGLWMLLGL